MIRLVLLCLTCAMLLSACGGRRPPEPPARVDASQFSGEKAFEETAALVAIGPRVSGTAGGQRAAFHLLDRLRSMGVDARLEVFTNSTPSRTTVYRNVVGILPGKGSGIVILGSHYDTKYGIAGFVGANDSGSSSGALLEVARVLAASPVLDPEVRVVFFDGEEAFAAYGPNDGLQGSRHHARRLKAEGKVDDVRAMILMDMVGDRNLTVTLPNNGSPWLTSAVLQAAHAENARSKFTLFPFEVGDDHDPFREMGIHAVDVIDFQYGSRPGLNDYWHTEQDALDKLSAESLRIVGRVVLRTLNTAMERNADDAP